MRLTAEELKDYLDRNNFSQCGFADFIGVHKRTVERWVLKKKRPPKWLRHIVNHVPISAMSEAVHKYKRFDDPASDLKHLRDMAHINPLVLRDMELVEMTEINQESTNADL